MRRRLLAAAAVLAALIAAGAALATQHGSGVSVRFEVLAHATPTGGGYSGDVVLHRRHVYLSSHKGKTSCPATGVRVFNLGSPRSPQRVATFGRIAQTWTEKTIVRTVATPSVTGDLAVTSVQ